MTAAWDDKAVSHRYADLGDIRLHYAEAGAGPLVVLLHGFPEFWYSWRHQIPALADAGFHVVAPDMRGYNRSDKPPGVHSYDLDLLTRDVARLIEACGAEQAAIVGHDWGAVVAWMFAMRYPEKLTRLAILNVPHPARTDQAMRSPAQLLRSWYIFFFQLPWLPEQLFSAGQFAILRRTLRDDPAHKGAFSDADIERYVEALAQPGALAATINYYRALVRGNPRGLRRKLARIDAPVLVIWGDQDRYIGKELADPPAEWVSNARVERFADASHWVQVDRPERVNRLLLEFLAPVKDGAARQQRARMS